MCKTAEEAAWNALSAGADKQGLKVVAALIQRYGYGNVAFDLQRNYPMKTLRLTAHLDMTFSEDFFDTFRREEEQKKGWRYGG